MKTVGIICEYNPLHLGHARQIHAVRALCGADTAVVCLMSGNFVQRGAPALLDKSLRAKAAVLTGADLVLELPTVSALSSAEGFASGGVRILSPFCDALCFGAESGSRDTLLRTAQALLSDDFPPLLRGALAGGASFPAARQAALKQMGLDGAVLVQPNDILAVEYCKAILAQNSAMEILPVRRGGSYHAALPDPENPSATSIRAQMRAGYDWKPYIPEKAQSVFDGAALHTIESGERAVLARLRTMTDAEFEALPYGSEGLWRKLMHAARSQPTLEAVIEATKSKRYTRTRLDRMVMCAFLELSRDDLLTPAPYVRVLAFTNRGRQVLRRARQSGDFLNAGEPSLTPYGAHERRMGDLYGLFAADAPEAPGAEARRRVYYHAE